MDVQKLVNYYIYTCYLYHCVNTTITQQEQSSGENSSSNCTSTLSTVLSSISSTEANVVMKYKVLVDEYFSQMIPTVYLSSIQDDSVYYVDDNGNVVTASITRFFEDFLTCVKSVLVSLYTYVELNQDIIESIQFNNTTLINILRSFGLYDSFSKLPLPVLRNLVYKIVRIYKYKGSADSFSYFCKDVLKKDLRILEGYSYVKYDITSFQSKLVFDFRDPYSKQVVEIRTEDEISRKHYYLTSTLYSRVIR